MVVVIESIKHGRGPTAAILTDILILTWSTVSFEATLNHLAYINISSDILNASFFIDASLQKQLISAQMKERAGSS